jgi:hypothetical protein
MVTGAAWTDMDKDGDQDLVVCCEWGVVDVFIKDKGGFTRKSLTKNTGWWNFVLPVDVDNDGDMDLIAGNLGLNSRLKLRSKSRSDCTIAISMEMEKKNRCSPIL